MRSIGFLAGGLLVFVGIFWSGRESTHGVGALWEHWWCPVPLAAILIGVAITWLSARRGGHTS